MLSLVWLLAFFAVLLPSRAASAASADENFYRGKTIRVVVGFAAGGGFDAYARVIARHMGRYIPG
ncbi:MAG TPA: hypothetical protein VNN13_08930, partial [Methylomirabilota bacterium]|nr:hypothetical protein [Methylomirabilota bacterium]